MPKYSSKIKHEESHSLSEVASPIYVNISGISDVHKLIMKITTVMPNMRNIMFYREIDKLISHANNIERSDVHRLIELFTDKDPYKDIEILEIFSKLIVRYPEQCKEFREPILTFFIETPYLENVLDMLLKYDYDINVETPHSHRTALNIVVSNGIANTLDTRRVEILIRYGANINHINSNNESTLFIAIKTYYYHYLDSPEKEEERLLKYVILLLSNSASPNITGSVNSPLLLAIERKLFKTMLLLLQNGADPCVSDKKGISAIDYLKKCNNHEMLKILKSFM